VLGISGLAEDLLDFQEGLSFIDLVGWLVGCSVIRSVGELG